MIDIALVIDSPWIELILSGKKTWEIRGKPNSRVGRIALCRKGGLIVATCLIEQSISLSRLSMGMHFDKHALLPEQIAALYGDSPLFAWPLSDVRSIDPPIKINNPGGWSWVALSAENVPEFQRLSA